MAESIKVAVRVRPINGRERDKRCTVVVSMTDQTTTIQYGRTPKHFTYDFSYWSLDPESSTFATQEDVFRDIGKIILANALDGFNGTLFTYGQTGSGKSYCMMGPTNDPGIIPRTVERLFRLKAKREDSERELQIWISYLEIYKEQVTDLLCAEKEPKPSDNLKIMDHPKLGVYVRGLQEVPCAAQEEVMKILTYGIKKRVVAATNMNARSSRSHAVFTIRVNSLEGPRPKPGQKDERKTLHAKLNLIDLAGSERTSKAMTEGVNLREGCAINQSLSALGMIIKTLSEAAEFKRSGSKDDKSGAPPAPPFRMSKLTFLLKDSLAGNSKTYMMATISPANENVDETLSTLRFASSVKNIKTVAVQNKDQKDQLIEKMEEEIRALKAQVRTGGLNIDEASELVLERTRLRDEMQKDFQGELQVAREMQTAREQALEENGLSQYHITQAFGISKGSPYLLNMADDPMLAGCLIYLLKDSEVTRIGASKENTITLKGVGIPDVLCCILNSENTNVSIELLSNAGRVVVNGRLLQVGHPRQLHNGDHIFLGRAYALKLIMPQDASSPGTDPNDLSLEGLEDEYAALDDSPSWRSLAMYLDQVLRQMPANSASELFKEMKKACQFCDEANELTSECRSDEPIHFEVDLTSSVPACVVIRVLYCTQGRDCEDEDAWETKYLWTVNQLIERLDRMRDCCEVFKRVGYMEIELLEDPWHEIEYAELSQRMRNLELEKEEARATMFQEKLRKMRTLLAIRPSDRRTNQTILQIFLRFWKMHVEETRRDGATPGGRGRGKAQRKIVLSSPSSTPRSSNQKRASSVPNSAGRSSSTSTISEMTTSATSSLTVSPGLPPPTHERLSTARRLTLKRSVHYSADLLDSPTFKEKPEPRKVRIDTPKPDNEEMQEADNPFQLEDNEEKGNDRQDSPESTPEATSTSSNMQKLKADDLEMLKTQLEGCQQENLDLQRQLDIAWQLCAVLRDYALKDRDQHEHPEPEKDRELDKEQQASAVPSWPPSTVGNSEAADLADVQLRPAAPTRQAPRHVAVPALPLEAKQARTATGINSVMELPRQPASGSALRGRSAEKSPPKRQPSPSPVGVPSKAVAYPVANTAVAMATVMSTKQVSAGSSIGGVRVCAAGGAVGARGHWLFGHDAARSPNAGPQVVRVGSVPPRLPSQRQQSADAPRAPKAARAPQAASAASMVASVASSLRPPQAQPLAPHERVQVSGPGSSDQAAPFSATAKQAPSAIQGEPSPAKRPEAKDSMSELPDRARKPASPPGRMTLLEEQVRSLMMAVKTDGSQGNGSNASAANE
mmetsp:Transcript_24411/g.43349  ORF Transcript_24411/g.43349 Transcript_24411/m.43349 type:complete len:1306 (-) Transcript_24411:15-3932(-)